SHTCCYMESPTPDLDYKYSIVSFFDVMGFQSLITSRSPEEIKRILTWFDYICNSRTPHDTGPGANLSRMAADDKELVYTGFSDLGIRSVNVHSASNLETPYGALFYEILDLTHIQMELVAKSILIRGGV